MSKRASRADLENMYRSKQVIPHDRLLTILGHFGFESRDGGRGSHTMIWNPLYPELPKDTISSHTKKVDGQRNAIKQCLQILQWEEEAQAAGLESAPQAIEEFKIASANKEVVIPEAYELVQGRKNPGKFLRHRRLPQIATELVGDISQENIDMSIGYLDERVKKLDETLNLAVKSHDFEMDRYPNGTIILLHPAYIRGIVLYPFTPRLNNWTVISEIEGAIEAVEQAQINSAQSLKDVVNNYGLKEQNSTSKTHRTFSLSNPFFDDIHSHISLPVTPHGHFSSPDFMKFIQNIEQKLFQGLHKHMRAGFGFNLTKVNDSKIKGSHILYDIEFEIDVSDFNTPYVDSDFHDEYFSADKKDQQEKIRTFIEILERHKSRHDTIKGAIQEFSNQLNQSMVRLNAIIPDDNDRIVQSKPKPGTLGKLNFRLHGKMHALDVLFIRSRDNVKQFIPTNETLETLEKLAKSAFFTPHAFAPSTTPQTSSAGSVLPLPPLFTMSPK